MSLINCSECGKEISDKAAACPNCGAPLELNKISNQHYTVNGTEKTLKKKKSGCLKYFLICIIFSFAVAMIQEIGSEKEPSVTTSDKAVSKDDKDEKVSLLEFDDRSWKDFKVLYISHNNFINAIDSYSNNQISSLDFFNYCKDIKDYFGKISTTFDYGTTDEEKTYLSVYESVALSDQQAAASLIKYIDSNKTSDLSKAQEKIQTAKDAFTMIASNRGTLLVKAGLSDDEIKEKVEADMADLDSEIDK